MSFSVSAEAEDFEYSGTASAACSPSRSNLARPRFARMVADYVRFNRDGARAAGRPPTDRRSLRAFLERRAATRRGSSTGCSCPQASAVWSADPEQMWAFPARFLVRVLRQPRDAVAHRAPAWSTITGGSARYVEALTAPFARPHPRPHAGRRRQRAIPTHVDVVAEGGPAERLRRGRDRRPRRPGAGDARRPEPRRAEILGAIPYQPNEAVLHTDRSLLPRRRAAWSAWNYHLLAEPTRPLRP